MEMRRSPNPRKTPAERAETKAKSDAWRERCLRYRAEQDAQGIPVIPRSESVMLDRIDRHWTSANASPGFQIRMCDQASAKVNAKRGGGL